MARRRLLWQLFPSYLVVCAAATVAVASFAVWQFRDFYVSMTLRGLEARAKFVSFNMRKGGGLADRTVVDPLCKNLGEHTGTHITVVDETGEVLGDSDVDPAKMKNLLAQGDPEIQEAARTRSPAHRIRRGSTTGDDMIYLALPVEDGGVLELVVRTGLPMRQVNEAMRSIYVGIGLSLVAVAAVVGGVSLVLARRVSRPLEVLKEGAESFAEGRLDQRLAVPDLEEAGSLAETLNHMAARLEEQMRAMARLETARRDFVGNVAHELRTPITPIRAAVETLRAGGIDDKEQAGRFLAMIARQADRLTAIIEDLLRLSQIEQYEQGAGALEMMVTELHPVVEAARVSCDVRARQRQITVEVDCPEGLEARINPPLLESAVVNLVDNAVKYSDEGQRVWVEVVGSDAGGADIRVRDEGCGIEPEHLPRLFQRFYRVDKARSRHLGGTGLGLSLVKHIVQLHGGSVTVDSRPGVGSTFTIHLPPPARPVRADA